MVKFRLAQREDINQLVDIHIESGKGQPGGFMYKLGYAFMRKYYAILLSEKSSLVILAEDDDGLIYGFCSGTLNVSEHIQKLKRNRFALFFYVFPELLRSPKLFSEMYKRYKHLNNNNSIKYNNKEGVRNEYWVWRDDCDKSLSTHLFKTWLNIVFSFGYDSVKGEVDSVNKHIVVFHKILGAKVLDEVNLPDGRKRYFVEYKNVKGKMNF
jgi:hypothetical protein